MSSEFIDEVLVNTLRQYGPCSFAEVTRRSGYSRKTVERRLRQLEKSGRVLRAGEHRRIGQQGRPSVLWGVTGLHQRSATVSDRVRAVLAVEGDMVCAEVRDLLGCHHEVAKHHLRRLVASGRVVVVAHRSYRTGGKPVPVFRLVKRT